MDKYTSKLLLLGIVGLWVVGICSGQTEYKAECTKDISKEASVEGNYVDCTGEKHVADGSTDCCNVDGVIDCCNKSASWWTLVFICIGIGSTTIVLALLCFWIYWCDERTCPWVGPYKRKWDEKTGKVKRKICCCCVNDDDEDEYHDEKKGGLPEQEVRPSSSISVKSSSYHGNDRALTPSSIDSQIVDVQPGPESMEMPPEYKAEVKDEFLNF